MQLTLIFTSLILSRVHAHMEMLAPLPFRSKFDPANKASGNIDYSMTSPLLSSGADFPCKGYQNDQPMRPTATYAAGSKHTLKLAGSTMHMGGSCQLSMSYDNGKTFRVIKSMIGGCPDKKSYGFTVPRYAPDGVALLAWTWVNLVGNREFYMNCAAVQVTNPAPRHKVRHTHDTRNDWHLGRHARRATSSKKYTSWSELPYLWKANLPSENECKTEGNVEVVYPHPGPEVVYGSGLTSKSRSTAGTCDRAGPPGPTYKQMSPSSAETASGGDADSGENDHDGMHMSETSSSYANSHKTVPTRDPLPFPNRPVRPPYPVSNTTTSSTSSSTTHTSTSTSTSSASSSISSKPSAPSTPPDDGGTTSNRPSPNSIPYYGDSPNSTPGYTPCLPGTFLCLSSTRWAQCVPTASGGGTYTQIGSVAAGMECMPSSSPNGAGTAALARGGGAAGTHRDDQMVRRSATGHCVKEGEMRCLRDGKGWAMCAQGAWVDMGGVAAGTVCRDGAVVGL